MKMVKKYFFRVHGPAESIIVRMECDPHILPSETEKVACAHALKAYVKKYKNPVLELIKVEEESPIVLPTSQPN